MRTAFIIYGKSMKAHKVSDLQKRNREVTATACPSAFSHIMSFMFP
jgi:hypothetical protein